MSDKTFKISELPQIKNIDNEDLLLISDYESGKCLSKKITIQQLVQHIVSAITTTSAIEQTTMNIVEENIADIYDMLDGVKDNEILIDGGNAEAI